jgi:hypothetical protein
MLQLLGELFGSEGPVPADVDPSEQNDESHEFLLPRSGRPPVFQTACPRMTAVTSDARVSVVGTMATPSIFFRNAVRRESA